MTRLEALKIFNLSGCYTEEQLKQVYKKLMKENHPDYKQNLTDEEIKAFDEKTKRINEAFDLLYDKKNHRVRTGYYDNNTNYAQQPSFDLKKYKENLIKTIEFRIGKTKNPIIKVYYNGTFVIYSIMIISNDTKEAVDEAYEKINKKIIQKFKEFKDDYFLKWDLTDDQVHEEINYEADFDTFYKQLESIKRKYSKKYQLICLIDQETAKYKLYALYNDQIKELIEVAKSNALKNAKKTNYQNLDIIIQIMHNEIEEVFQTISFIERKIRELQESVNRLKVQELFQKFECIVSDYRSGIALADVKTKLSDFEVEVDETAKLKAVIEKKIKELQESVNRLKVQKLFQKFGYIISDYRSGVALGEVKTRLSDFEVEVDETEKLKAAIDEKIKELAVIVKEIDGTHISRTFTFRAILLDYQNQKDLNEVMQNLLDLEQQINALKDHERKIKEEDPIVKEIYSDILNKFSEKMKQTHPVDHTREAMHLTELLNKILRLFKKYNDGTCELDVLKTLQTIDFEDLEALETFLDFYLAVEKNTSLNDNYIETIDVTNNIKEDIININNIKKKL